MTTIQRPPGAPPELRAGDHIDITLRGEVLDTERGGVTLAVGDEGRASVSPAAMASTAVTVTRQAPAQWPPRLGDVWKDRKGNYWFGRASAVGEGGVLLIPAVGPMPGVLAAAAPPRDPQRWLNRYGPAELAYRVGYGPAELADAAGGDA